MRSSKPRKRKASPAKAYRPYRMRIPQTLWLVPIAMFFGFGGMLGFFAWQEMLTSKLQADYLSKLASEIGFELKDGPNPEITVPSDGPYNQRLGYSYLPFFTKALGADGYTVTQQMRASPRYDWLLDEGLYPIYRAKTTAGLALYDRDGKPLYSASYPSKVFADFASVPPLLVTTLLHIENRELLKSGPTTRNPVIEWDRFLYAAVGHLAQKITPAFNVGGGSTLATQIEKFRFSPNGQTGDAVEKLRQIASASMRVYLDGPDTRAARERIALEYLNSTPLSARQGFGEVNGIGDGLWAWFGRDLSEAITALNLPETDRESLRVKAAAYREALALILSQRRPTYYLLSDRKALDKLINETLAQMASTNVISWQLAEATGAEKLRFLPEAPVAAQRPFIEQKAVNALRTRLLSKLGLKNLYELDRLDMSVVSTLDGEAQQKLAQFLGRMGEREFVESIGLYGFRLLKPENDPSRIRWSVVLYERGGDGNRLRVQGDNIDAPLDMNEGVKLDLGSTAKLRTLVTYLEIVWELHRRYSGLAIEDLKDLAEEAPDVLTSWATTWLSANPAATLREMLEAAMDRKYSASPYETFFTGGGAHTFVNFEKREDGRVMDLREAMRDSVNLVFVRLMRDIVNYTISQGSQTKQEILGDRSNPARKEYLERYAEKEGGTFLNRYINDYSGLSPDNALEKITAKARKGATARTILFRSLRPQAGYGQYVAYMRKNPAFAELDDQRLSKLFRDYPADRYNLADKGYIAGINPLELWLVSYIQANPRASRNEIMTVSKKIRLESYSWLFHPRMRGAQDTRIRILLEADAFVRIHERWSRLGYPFDKLVPSLATSIGSSADKPGALAELVGILLNDGVKKPYLRFEKLRLAENTPYETALAPDKSGARSERVLDEAVAQVAREAMIGVVENGTAKRLNGAYKDADGNPIKIGGKTGTGDHRYEEFGAGGRLISSRVVNRTGTIAFFIGERFFGTVTAHVEGEEAEDYVFTSALSAQMLKSLEPVFSPLIRKADSATPPRLQP